MGVHARYGGDDDPGRRASEVLSGNLELDQVGQCTILANGPPVGNILYGGRQEDF